MKQILLFILGILIHFSGAFAQQDTLEVLDLRSLWQTVDKEGNLQTYEKKSKVAIVDFPQFESNGVILKITAADPTDIWINGALVDHGFSGVKLLSVDSIFNSYTTSPMLALYCSGGLENLETQIIQVLRSENPNVLTTRDQKRTDNFFLFALTVLLLLFGVYKRYFPISFKHTFSTPLSYKFRSLSLEESYVGFASQDNLYAIALLAALFSVVLIQLNPGGLPYEEVENIWISLWTWLSLIFTVVLVIVVKFLWCRLVAALYQLNSIPNIQIQDFIHFFILVSLLILIFATGDYVAADDAEIPVLPVTIYVLVFSICFFLVWFYFKFLKYSGHRKLMIITYLCTTEFLPGFLTIYWLVKN